MPQPQRHLIVFAVLCASALLLTGTTLPQAISFPCHTEAFERRIYELVSIEVEGTTLEVADATGEQLPDHWCVRATGTGELKVSECRLGHWVQPERVHSLWRVDR